MLRKISSTIGYMHQAMLDRTGFIITVWAERLTESESESRSTSKPIKTATNKRFLEIQSDDIPIFVNQKKKQKHSKQNIL